MKTYMRQVINVGFGIIYACEHLSASREELECFMLQKC